MLTSLRADVVLQITRTAQSLRRITRAEPR